MGRLPFLFPLRCFTLILTIACLGKIDNGSARAELICPQPLVNAGEVRSGTPLQHCFRFKNQGDQAVEITEIKSGCACLKPHLKQRNYQPGEEGSLVLEVNTLSEAAGRHSWRLQVLYRESGQLRELALQMNGQIVAEVSVQPAALTLTLERTGRHALTLIDVRPHPLQITQLQSSSPHVKVQPLPMGRDSLGRWLQSLQIEVTASCPEGRHTENLRIFTNDPIYRELNVPLTIVKRSLQRVVASTNLVAFHIQGGLPVPVQTVIVRDIADDRVIIERVEADDPALHCDWSCGPMNAVTIRISVDRERAPKLPWHSTVRIHIRRPAAQTMVLPVQVQEK